MTDKTPEPQQELDKTAKKKKRKPNSGAFKKGEDPRRNKKGRGLYPSNTKELNELLHEIASEELTNSDGVKITRLRAMLRSMMTSRSSADKQHILDRMYGKVPDKIELDGKEAVTLTVIYKDKKKHAADEPK